MNKVVLKIHSNHKAQSIATKVCRTIQFTATMQKGQSPWQTLFGYFLIEDFVPVQGALADIVLSPI